MRLSEGARYFRVIVCGEEMGTATVRRPLPTTQDYFTNTTTHYPPPLLMPAHS